MAKHLTGNWWVSKRGIKQQVISVLIDYHGEEYLRRLWYDYDKLDLKDFSKSINNTATYENPHYVVQWRTCKEDIRSNNRKSNTPIKHFKLLKITFGI